MASKYGNNVWQQKMTSKYGYKVCQQSRVTKYATIYGETKYDKIAMQQNITTDMMIKIIKCIQIILCLLKKI